MKSKNGLNWPICWWPCLLISTFDSSICRLPWCKLYSSLCLLSSLSPLDWMVSAIKEALLEIADPTSCKLPLLLPSHSSPPLWWWVHIRRSIRTWVIMHFRILVCTISWRGRLNTYTDRLIHFEKMEKLKFQKIKLRVVEKVWSLITDHTWYKK